MTSEQKKAYDQGWNAAKHGARPAAVEAADKRRASSYWYIGHFDRDAGNTKYEGVPA